MTYFAAQNERLSLLDHASAAIAATLRADDIAVEEITSLLLMTGQLDESAGQTNAGRQNRAALVDAAIERFAAYLHGERCLESRAREHRPR